MKVPVHGLGQTPNNTIYTYTPPNNYSLGHNFNNNNNNNNNNNLNRRSLAGLFDAVFNTIRILAVAAQELAHAHVSVVVKATVTQVSNFLSPEILLCFFFFFLFLVFVFVFFNAPVNPKSSFPLFMQVYGAPTVDENVVNNKVAYQGALTSLTSAIKANPPECVVFSKKKKKKTNYALFIWLF